MWLTLWPSMEASLWWVLKGTMMGFRPFTVIILIINSLWSSSSSSAVDEDDNGVDRCTISSGEVMDGWQLQSVEGEGQEEGRHGKNRRKQSMVVGVNLWRHAPNLFPPSTVLCVRLSVFLTLFISLSHCFCCFSGPLKWVWIFWSNHHEFYFDKSSI